MTYQKYLKNIFLFSLVFSVVLFSCKKGNNAKAEADNAAAESDRDLKEHLSISSCMHCLFYQTGDHP